MSENPYEHHEDAGDPISPLVREYGSKIRRAGWMVIVPTVAMGISFTQIPRPVPLPTSVVPMLASSASLVVSCLILTRLFRVGLTLRSMRTDFRSEILSLEERCLTMFRQQVVSQRMMAFLLVAMSAPIGSFWVPAVTTAIVFLWQASFFLVRDSAVQQELDEVLFKFRGRL